MQTQDINPNHRQQGDVWMQRLDKIPAGFKLKKKGLKSAILAHGEHTGHAHRIAEADDVEIYEHEDGRVIIKSRSAAPVTHEEHKPVPPFELMEVGQVVEYDYDTQESRRVVD